MQKSFLRLAPLQHGTFTLRPSRPSLALRNLPTICPTLQISFRRPITNASKPDHVLNMLQVPVVEPKPGGWKPTLIHSSDEVKFTVIRVNPDGEVPIHYHNKSWDYFVPLQGQAVIETRTKSGDTKDYPMEIHSFLAVPPEDVHRVRNKSSTDEFVFLIAQSPRSKYDFVDV